MRASTVIAAAAATALCGCMAQDPRQATPPHEENAGPSFTKEQLRLPGKKGIGFTLRDPAVAKAKAKGGTWDQNIRRIKALDVAWNYSWGMRLVPVQPEDIEFIPMKWGGGLRDFARTVEEQLKPHIESGRIKRFLGFNEPDHKKQANMPFMRAVEQWPALMELGVPLCSPGCANTEGIDDETAQGVPGTWMRDFMREIDKRGYRVDYVAVHWYGGTNAEAFKGKMRRIYEKYGRRPLLLTEFAPADWRAKSPAENRHTPEKVLAFMKEVLPWMEKQEWIAGYAWFPFRPDSAPGTCSALFAPDGELTACGRYYRSVSPDNPDGDQQIEPDPRHIQ